MERGLTKPFSATVRAYIVFSPSPRGMGSLYGFSSSHVWMRELDCKESWALKNWYFQTVVLEKTLESPLDCEKIKPVNTEGNQCWIFIQRTDAEAKTPILWPPDANSWLIWKDPDAGEDWGQEVNGMTEDEMVGWHHQLSGHGFGWTGGISLQSKGFSRVFSNTMVQKHQFFELSFLYTPTLTSIHDYWKNHSLD